MPTHQYRLGMTCAIFTRRSQEVDDLTALLSTPGFRRLDLALFTGQGNPEDWDDLRTDSFRQLLASAPQLEHFDFSCSTDPIGSDAILSVQDIFPVASWPNLRHFGIHQLNVLQSDLLSLLAALPVSIRSVKLIYLDLDRSGSYHTLLCDMRDELGWRDRAPDKRPHVRIILHLETVKWYESIDANVDTTDDPADYLLIDESTNKYLYSSTETDGNPNPFAENWPYTPNKGMGIVARSWADPSFETQY